MRPLHFLRTLCLGLAAACSATLALAQAKPGELLEFNYGLPSSHRTSASSRRWA